MSNQAVFNTYLLAAREAQAQGAPINPLAAAGQACLESGFGAHIPMGSNNVLGIKAGSTWTGPSVSAVTGEYRPEGSFYRTTADFRAYPNVGACFRDYGSLIGGLPWFRDAAERAEGEPRPYLNALEPIYGSGGNVVEPGYATDPNYTTKVMAIIDAYLPGAPLPIPSDPKPPTSEPLPLEPPFEDQYPALEGVNQLWIDNNLYGNVRLARQVGHKLYVTLDGKTIEPSQSGIMGLLKRICGKGAT